MSAQKRDLSRRLKAAESSNRQLRSELQELRAGGRNGPAIRPMSTQLSSMTTARCAGVRGKGCCFSFCTDVQPSLSPSGNDLSLYCMEATTLSHKWTAVSCRPRSSC